MIYNRPESWMKKKVRIISFTIDGTSYQAEEGMTWGEWYSSKYNTGGYQVAHDNIVGSSGIVAGANDFVYIKDVIVDGFNYTITL